ncbi:hypothetical protein ACWGJB_03760 [Streptomyces sp. NPDC054813]
MSHLSCGTYAVGRPSLITTLREAPPYRQRCASDGMTGALSWSSVGLPCRTAVRAGSGSLFSVRALDLAADEAARRGSVLCVVYAVPDRDGAEPVPAASASQVRERHPALTVVISAEEEVPVQALTRGSKDTALVLPTG